MRLSTVRSDGGSVDAVEVEISGVGTLCTPIHTPIHIAHRAEGVAA